ncbi:hypothetical protein V2P41_01415 [Mesomycoplasma hyopneumoniae]|uniref:Mbov_0396 family ICE element transmembrane protein n=1 Tax=Mesomycoplasma hyopneumoniae TaxID=2099 RepID=UPI003DA6CBE5
MFGWLFSGLVSLITYPFFTLGWYLLVYLPLSVIAFFNFIFDQIGINVIVNAIFQKKSFAFENLPVGFWIFAITSVSMGFIVFILRYIKFLIIRKRSADSEIIAMGRVGFGSFAFIFLFPIIFFALLITIQSTLFLINQHIRGDQNLITVMLKSASDKIPEEEIKWISENYGSPSYSTFSGMESGEAISLIITLSASSLVIAYILGISFISWFTSSAQLFMNFLTMPVWAMTSIWDDGRRLKTWTKNFLGQFAIIIVYQISFNLFLIWVGSTYQIADLIDLSQVTSSQIFRFLIRISFIIGGGLAIAAFTRQIASQFGQEGAVDHQQRLASSTLKVGAVGIAGAAGVLGFLNKNGKNDKLDVSGLFEKNKNKNPFNVVDNSLAPGNSKLTNWRGPSIMGALSTLATGSAMGYQGVKYAKKKYEQFKNWRAKRALDPNHKNGPTKLFIDKIGRFFRKNKKSDSSNSETEEEGKVKNKRKTAKNSKSGQNITENSNEKNNSVETKLENSGQSSAEVEQISEENQEKLEEVGVVNNEKSEKTKENGLKNTSETQNLDQKEDLETNEIVEEAEKSAEKTITTTELSTEKTEKLEENAVVEPKKQGFWEWFWGKLPEEEKKTKRKPRTKVVETSEKPTKKVTKKVKKTPKVELEKRPKKEKKVKTVEEKEKKPRGKKKKVTENQLDSTTNNQKTVNQTEKIELKNQDNNIDIEKDKNNQENIKSEIKEINDLEKQIKPENDNMKSEIIDDKKDK